MNLWSVEHFLAISVITFGWVQQQSKDTIYTKLALMPWIGDNLGHTLSGLTQIGNIITKIFWKFTIFQVIYRFPL